jgi:hypothetical protein
MVLKHRDVLTTRPHRRSCGRRPLRAADRVRVTLTNPEPLVTTTTTWAIQPVGEPPVVFVLEILSDPCIPPADVTSAPPPRSLLLGPKKALQGAVLVSPVVVPTGAGPTVAGAPEITVVPPTTPVAPVTSLGPLGPVGPRLPVAPLAPVGPREPVGPGAPVAPRAPVVPLSPVEPLAPFDPAAPGGAALAGGTRGSGRAHGRPWARSRRALPSLPSHRGSRRFRERSRQRRFRPRDATS